jgi:hypothetical protein
MPEQFIAYVWLQDGRWVYQVGAGRFWPKGFDTAEDAAAAAREYPYMGPHDTCEVRYCEPPASENSTGKAVDTPS